MSLQLTDAAGSSCQDLQRFGLEKSCYGAERRMKTENSVGVAEGKP
jgi:hypothetical protein